MSSKLIVDTIEDATGTYSLALGSGNSTFPGGIHIGGTGSSNLLDDYEEGTWTPTYLGDSSNPTVSFTSQIGRYTKIGRLVSVYGYLRPSSVSGGSGGLAVGGLPFQNDNVTYTAATVGYVGGWVSNESPTRLLCHPSDPKITVYRQASSDPRDSISRVQTSSLANNCELYFSAVYYSS